MADIERRTAAVIALVESVLPAQIARTMLEAADAVERQNEETDLRARIVEALDGFTITARWTEHEQERSVRTKLAPADIERIAAAVVGRP